MEDTMGQTVSRARLDAWAGALILAIGMGFGRFSFTAMYPLMVRDALIDVGTGSLAASANYAGYLLGAILAARFRHEHAARLAGLSMIATTVLLAALSFHEAPSLIVAIRFVAGAVSAISFVAASVWLFHVIGDHHGAPVLYAGVGIGIVASAELVAIGASSSFNSLALWALLAAVSLLLSVAAWQRVRDAREHADADDHAQAAAAGTAQNVLGAYRLVTIYGLSGFGYIVTATYLPLLVKQALPQLNPVHIWAVFGLGAVPSCFLWHWLHHKLGTRLSLAVNLLVQAVGVVLPALDASALTFVASALLVGGTFVGTVTIAMPAARRVARTVRFNIMATMTAAYGVGQIVGPLVSGALFARTHSFDQPLVAAGAGLAVAALLTCRSK
ncbi:MAG TPA: YbfB/YjiJ family MFS transporter [Paraburkholderia sp.]|jgi:MFS family permease|nr:YbfB/YjiJ family MFS transporter [Paraburkholderia sp.]